MIRTARRVNDDKPVWVVEQVKSAVADCLFHTDKRAGEVTIACFGLAFKPDIDDLRESPAVSIACRIGGWHRGATLVVEPNIGQLPPVLAGQVTLAGLEDALSRADVLVMLVDHRQFKALPPSAITQKWVVDTRGVWR